MQTEHAHMRQLCASRLNEHEQLKKQLQGQSSLADAIETELTDTRSSIKGIEHALAKQVQEGRVASGHSQVVNEVKNAMQQIDWDAFEHSNYENRRHSVW